MKSRIIVLFVLLLLSISDANPAFAHTLKSSGSVGAVMHVQPDDDPIVGEESSFFFEFKDTENKFDPKNCACTFSILQNGTILHTQPLFQANAEPSLMNASAFYTFPTRGVYTITVKGTPQTQGAFSDFTLSYDIRVERTSGQQKSTESNWFIDHIPQLVGGIIGFSVLGFILYNGRKKDAK